MFKNKREKKIHIHKTLFPLKVKVVPSVAVVNL